MAHGQACPALIALELSQGLECRCVQREGSPAGRCLAGCLVDVAADIGSGDALEIGLCPPLGRYRATEGHTARPDGLRVTAAERQSAASSSVAVPATNADSSAGVQ